MLEKLDFIEEKYEDLGKKIADPEVIADTATWQKYMKEHASLEPIVEKYREYKKIKEGIDEAKSVLKESGDEEIKELAKIELDELEEKLPQIEKELKVLLLPKDPNDDRNVIVEIRAGAGGDEAGLFASDLFRLYTRYAERKGWKFEMFSINETGVVGIK